MRYAQLRTMDVTNGPGIGVAFFTQYCPHRCPGCFNPETWSLEGGKEFTPEILSTLLEALKPEYITRLSILGGEPLCPENIFLTSLICSTVKEKFPNIKIYIWTGYVLEDLIERNDPKLNKILNGEYADILIDGPFMQELKDFTLELRGSSNQRIIELPYE